MRNAVGIFVMLFAFVAVQAQTKVAHINSSQLIEAMPEADSIQKKLMKEQEQWQQILADKQSETRTKYESYLKQTEDPNAYKAMLEIKAQEIENLQKQLQELNQRASEELQRKQEELLAPLLEKVKKTIAEVAKANGYAYVMDTTDGSGIIYSDASYDIMAIVKAKLGLK